MKTTGSVRVYNRFRVFCEVASLNNYIITLVILHIFLYHFPQGCY